MPLTERYIYGYGYNNYGDSKWSNWGRWVLLGGLIGVALLVFFLFSCTNARRRRRRGVDPMYGTGWLAGTPAGHGAAHYNPQMETTQPAQNSYYNNNATYETAPPVYGQQNNVELQQPANTYQPYGNGAETYAPPAGPPPATYEAPVGPPPGKAGRYT